MGENVEDLNYVFCCKHCLSLKIMSLEDPEDTLYCDECGSTEVETKEFDTWEKEYQKKYGYKFLNKKNYGRGKKRERGI